MNSVKDKLFKLFHSIFNFKKKLKNQEMNSIKDKFFIFFLSKFILKKKLKNIIVNSFVEEKIKAPLFIILKTINKVELKGGLIIYKFLLINLKI
jgi:hypothetical protein